MIIWFWVLAFAKSKTIFLFVICGVSLVSIYDDKKVSRRIYRHSSTEFPFELAHENSPANFMREFHWHDFLEITYVNAGEGTYYIEDKIIPVKAGDFLVINNIERHRVTFNAKNPLYETVFHFDSEMLDNVLISTFNIFNYNSTMFFNKLTPSPENRKNLESIVSVIVDEFKRKEPCYELCIISQLLRFVAIAYRSGDTYLIPPPQRAKSCANITRLESILQYLSNNLGPETTSKGVAERFFLNQSYFSEYFKKMMGITFTEYMRELRISKAVQLMISGEDKIVDIALACGFSSVSAFYSAFCKVHGIPPKKYISQKKRNLSR